MAEFESGGTSLATLDARFVNVTGDILTGALTLSGAPTVDLHASTKLYVDEQLATTDTLAELGDVTLTGLAGNNLLQYDSSSSRWVNRTLGAIADNRYVNTDGDTMTGTLVLPSLTLTDFSGALSASGGVVSAGTLSSANGGTGISSYTIGDLLYASGATTLSKLADVATGSVLASGGVGVAPAWSSTPTVSSLTATTSLILGDDVEINFGASTDASISWNTTQTVDALYIATATGQNTVIIAEIGDVGFDFAHGAKTHPTLFIHSATQATTDWMSLSMGGNAGGTIALIESGVSELQIKTGNTLLMNLATDYLTHYKSILMTDNQLVALGESVDSYMRWDTGQTNDSVTWSIRVNSVDGSGIIIICEKGDESTNFAYAVSVDPRLLIHSSDATVAADFISFWHDQTDANIEAGVGDLILTIAGGNLRPSADDAWAIGVSGIGVSDLFLATGGVINWNAGNVTLTHSANALNLTANSVNLADLTSTGYVFNEGGADIDMRWEGDTDINNLVLNAGQNSVLMGAASTSYTTKVAIVGNATDTYGLYVDRYDTTTTTNVGNGIVTYGFRTALGSATTTGTTGANIYSFSVTTDQRRSLSNLSSSSNQQTYGCNAVVVQAGNLTGTSWTAGQQTYWGTIGGNFAVQDYMGNTSNTTDTRPDFVGGNFEAVVVSYTINNASTSVIKTYKGGNFTADHRGGTLTAGTLTKRTYGGYFQGLDDTTGTSSAYGVYGIVLGADTNFAGYFGGPTAVVDLNGMAGTLSVDRGIIGNELGGDYDSRFEGDTATNLLVLDAGLDAVQIGTTTAGVIADFRTGAIVFNEDGADRDFRGESDDATDLFYFDAGADTGAGAIGFFSQTPQIQQATIADADGTLADITTKFNTLLADLEGYGLLKAA